MVHTFQALDKYFAVDTESGSVFELDELTHYLIIRRTDDTPENEYKLSKFSAPEIEGADFELSRLIGDGLLFSEGALLKDGQPSLKEKGRTAGGQVIKALCLNVCHTCNLRCGYCFADGGTYGGGQAMMSETTAKAAVDFLISRSGNRRNLEIDFFGGEPLLNFGVVKAAVKYARGLERQHKKNFRFTITTNGINLDKDKAAFINAEFSNVVISIDGRESVHNLIRVSADGRNYYNIISENARSLIKDRTGDYFIRGTFTNKNLDFTEDVKALDSAGFRYISFEPVALPESHALAIKEEHLPAIYREYEKLAGYLIEKGGAAPDFFHFRIDLDGAPCREKLIKGCGAGGEYAAVSPDGSVYPCHQFDGKAGYLMGVLDGNGFKPAAPEKTVPQYAVVNRDECKNCWAKYYCGGGCAAASVNFEKDGAPYSIACRLFKKRTEIAVALYALKR